MRQASHESGDRLAGGVGRSQIQACAEQLAWRITRIWPGRIAVANSAGRL
jgi:hypothetical protein